MSNEKKFRALADRIDLLVQEIAAIADPRTREKAEEVIRLLMELYGGGLARILEIIDETDSVATRLFDCLADDELVASVLLLHGIHPLPVETRIARALERVRPYLGSHGGDVKLLAVNDGVVRLRLEGTCHGCPSLTLTMKLAVERAIEEVAPEVSRIEVEGASEEPASTPLAGRMPAENGALASGEWLTLDKAPELTKREIITAELKGTKIVVCRVGETLYAYQDSCPSCRSSFGESALRKDHLLCAACSRSYDLRRAGQCLEAGELHLVPLPLIAEQGGVKIAVPAMSA